MALIIDEICFLSCKCSVELLFLYKYILKSKYFQIPSEKALKEQVCSTFQDLPAQYTF